MWMHWEKCNEPPLTSRKLCSNILPHNLPQWEIFQFIIEVSDGITRLMCISVRFSMIIIIYSTMVQSHFHNSLFFLMLAYTSGSIRFIIYTRCHTTRTASIYIRKTIWIGTFLKTYSIEISILNRVALLSVAEVT